MGKLNLECGPSVEVPCLKCFVVSNTLVYVVNKAIIFRIHFLGCLVFLVL